MLLFLVTFALAYDLEEACPTITVPSDALPWYDDRGVPEALVDLEDAAYVWYDAGCAWTYDENAQSCTTSAGAEWVVGELGSDPDSREWWSVVLPAGVDTWTSISFSSESSYEYDGSGSDSSENTTTMSWVGEPAGFPADASLAYAQSDSTTPWYFDESWTISTPACGWGWRHYYDLTAEPPWATTDSVAVDGQPAVSVGGNRECDEAPDYNQVAYLDGALYGRVDASWVIDDDPDYDGFGTADDCDQADPLVNECAVDIDGDGIDQDCDGVDHLDADGDGGDDAGHEGTDCDDTDPDVHRGAPDAAGDGIDQNCDGADEVDSDGDGYTADGDDGPPDCDDVDATVSPGAAEIFSDGTDQNCDGADETDADGDGYSAEGLTTDQDCDDTDPSTFPGASEVWDDGIDQDCDGADSTSASAGDPEPARGGPEGGCAGSRGAALVLLPLLLSGRRRRAHPSEQSWSTLATKSVSPPR